MMPKGREHTLTIALHALRRIRDVEVRHDKRGKVDFSDVTDLQRIARRAIETVMGRDQETK